MTERTCPGCGASINHRSLQTKYCSNTCRRWVANGHTELRLARIHCGNCLRAMPTGMLVTAIYCSKKCKMAQVEKRRVRDDHARYLRERERRITYAIAYAAAHPEVGQRAKRKRKALLSGSGIYDVSKRDWRRLCLRYGGRCAYCNEVAPLTMDHVVPISRGGVHSIGNLVPACANCNSTKRHRTVMEWRLGRRVSMAGGDSHPLEALTA
jgi:5-methylcytosine-specific restriction endonuclease McrA